MQPLTRSLNPIRISAADRTSSRRGAPARGRAAFTFIEVVVVMLVMGVLAAAAVPTFYRSLVHHRLESAARRVKHDLEYARDTARAQSGAVDLEFSGLTYTIDHASVDHLDHGGAYTVDLAAAPYNLTGVTADFAGDPLVTFDGYGTASADGEIVLQHGGQSRTVSVTSSSGHIAITNP